jgi:hypothetical protein
MRQFKEDRRQLKELILYISQQCAADPNYGSTHLYKTLFFADFLACLPNLKTTRAVALNYFA